MRFPDRLSDEFDTIAAIFDEALTCYVALTRADGPVTIPTIHARVDRSLYLHGSVLAGWLNASAGVRVCVSATIVDGLVMARSSFSHSMNYRSAIAFGDARAVTDADEKLRALEALVEHVCPGRWHDARQPNEAELTATLVVRVPIEEASAKIRTGPPKDAQRDLDLPTWAGCIPVRTIFGEAVPDPALAPGISEPDYVRARIAATATR